MLPVRTGVTDPPGSGPRGAQAFPEPGGDAAMAAQTERAEVVEVALPAAFRDGNDVVGFPEGHARAATGLPLFEKPLAALAAGVAQGTPGSDGVDATLGTTAAVAQENLLAQIGGLGAQPPLVDAIRGAEGEAAARDFERTPAAETAAIGSARNRFAVDPSAGHGARKAHLYFLNRQRQPAGAGKSERESRASTVFVARQHRRRTRHQKGGEKRERGQDDGGDLQAPGIQDDTKISALLAAGTATLDDPVPAPRAMLVFAHPEDETVALGARMGRFAQGWFVHVTDGAPRNEQESRKHGYAELADYREARRQEFRRALLESGADGARCEWLEIPDQEASLCLTQLTRRISQLLDEMDPELVFTHPYEGGHPDHDACAFAVHHAVAKRTARGEPLPLIVEGAFYNAVYAGMERGRFLPLAGAQAEIAYQLPPREQAKKRALLGCFATQQEMLQPFGVDCERFRVAPSYDFRRPPHEGPAWYERFGWGMTPQRFCELARQAEDALREEGRR